MWMLCEIHPLHKCRGLLSQSVKMNVFEKINIKLGKFFNVNLYINIRKDDTKRSGAPHNVS